MLNSTPTFLPKQAPQLTTTHRVEAGLPFLGAAAIGAGALSSRTLHGPRFRKLWANVYVDASTPESTHQRCAGLALLLPGAAFGHLTSMELAEVPTRRCEEIHVSVPMKSTIPARRPGLVVHERLDWKQPTMIGGLAHVPAWQTWLDLAPTLTLDELICLGDALLTALMVSISELQTGVADNANRRRGAVKAREAVGLVRVGSQSPPETMVRLWLVRTGLPEPQLNIDVLDAFGAWIARPDLSYEQWRIALEYEGEHHLLDRRQWQRARCSSRLGNASGGMDRAAIHLRRFGATTSYSRAGSVSYR